MQSVLKIMRATKAVKSEEKTNIDQKTEKDVTASTKLRSSTTASPQRSSTGKAKSAKSQPEPPSAETSALDPAQPEANAKREAWKVHKRALKEKYGEEGWQPRKRLSPDTLDGIRALHDSDPRRIHHTDSCGAFQNHSRRNQTYIEVEMATE